MLPPEDGETFAENALAKARAAAAATGMRCDRRRLRNRRRRARRPARGPLGPLRRRRCERRGEPRRSCWRRSRAARTARSPTSARWPTSGADGRELVGRGPLRGTLAADAARQRRLRLRPGLHPDDDGPGDERTMAELERRGEARDQPPRPRGAGPGRAAWRRGTMIAGQGRGRGALGRLQRVADRAQADRRRRSPARSRSSPRRSTRRSTCSPRWSRSSRSARRTSRLTPITPTGTRRPRTWRPAPRRC